MAPTEGRVAKPERWWGCHRGTAISRAKLVKCRTGHFSDDKCQKTMPRNKFDTL